VADVTQPLEPAVGDLLGHEDARHRAQVWPGPDETRQTAGRRSHTGGTAAVGGAC
jgi:hypothetical protein